MVWQDPPVCLEWMVIQVCPESPVTYCSARHSKVTKEIQRRRAQKVTKDRPD